MSKSELRSTTANVKTTGTATAAQPPIAPALFSDRVVITVDEFCNAVGFSRSKFYSECRAGRIRVLKAGKKSLLPASAPYDYLHLLQGEAA